ncbi:GTP cyclohydrolase I FolE [Nicoliella spurrieriana]|uniref:GTP cyclohydrolase 1 n=1 Tax=Nicoliella spurrieriana TaxID=2925830 RepID=A0A976RS06_9LACO|nr:GTP cyclohydrolase I FolE [Nicoliella spurrieriana]UQS86738.1 GTP cyclohydrolase I FolE [Nicoliella spurrieriana]
MNEQQQQKIESAVKDILTAVGEDPTREGLIETPKRVAKMYAEVFSSLNREFTNYKVFNSDVQDNGTVIVRDIPFYSMCEHHLLPFFGRVTVAYVPRDGKIIGLSKIPRLVDFVASRPSVQENVTHQIGVQLDEILHPKGIAVIADARHMCMEMRGVKKQAGSTKTTYYRGVFKDPTAKRELLDEIRLS